jgi:hypothetical protein
MRVPWFGGDEAFQVDGWKRGVVPPSHSIRGQKVMLDSDLAALYGVETKYLLRQVTRNAERFPADFMFSLDKKEVTRLRCQIAISKGRGGRRNRPYAFTEQGVAMLSGKLALNRTGGASVSMLISLPMMNDHPGSEFNPGWNKQKGVPGPGFIAALLFRDRHARKPKPCDPPHVSSGRHRKPLFAIVSRLQQPL